VLLQTVYLLNYVLWYSWKYFHYFSLLSNQ
jgi:hypothetical protein